MNSAWFKQHKIITGAGAVLAIVVVASIVKGPDQPTYETTTVQKATIQQTVTATGRVEPSDTITLAFERSGKVGTVSTVVGNKVTAGTLLVTLEQGKVGALLSHASAGVDSARAGVAQAMADRDTAQAKLADMVRGAKPQELTLAELKVTNASSALLDSKTQLVEKIREAYTEADDIVFQRVDSLFSQPRSTRPELLFPVGTQQLEIDSESGRMMMGTSMIAWQSLALGTTVTSDLSAARQASEQYSTQLMNLLANLASAVNVLTPTANISQTQIDVWQAAISSSRTDLNTVRANLTSVAKQVADAERAARIAEQEFVVAQTGAPREQIQSQEAVVRQTEAALAAAQARLKQAQATWLEARVNAGETVLRAPVDGVITAIDVSRGEIVSPNTPVVTMVSAAGFAVKANVSEAHIAAVTLGSEVDLTIDAYGSDEHFAGVVSAIDPAETIVDGIPTYKTTIRFVKADERIKSGLTANIIISGAKREGVLAVPERTLVKRDGQTFVRVLVNGMPQEQRVMIGLRGADGLIEIQSGVTEGDEVVVREIKK